MSNVDRPSHVSPRSFEGFARPCGFGRTWMLALCGLLGCARGAAVEELDASMSGVMLSDAGTDDAALPASNDAGPLPDAAIIDQGDNSKDAGAVDAGGEDPASCAATNLCVSPTMGGTVSGDTGSDTLDVTGATSSFVLINVSEDDHTPLFPRRLRVAATLNSPGADFDLYLHEDGCASLLDSSEVGFTESVDLTWDDVQGQESAKKLVLEVRHKTGACDPARPWVLTVRGN